MELSSVGKSLFAFKDPKDYDQLRSLLATVGYSDAGILKALGVSDMSSIQARDVALLLHRTNRGTPLDTLIRLFLIEVPCDAEDFQRAIRPMRLENWVQAGLVHLDQGRVTAAVRLLPYRNLILAFDLPRTLQSELAEYYVMGIGSSSLTLANYTVRKHSQLTLDLGTGCGIQAFLAAAHSDRVLAVDQNPRAVKLAAFNAGLNGLTQVECLQGDFFEPVKGHRFDLVVTNPPFVISPEKQYIYRDSGLPADEVCRQIVRQVPLFLNEDGFCHILCNWVEEGGLDWYRRLQPWFQDTGCDAWVMRTEARDVSTYASTWIRHTEQYRSEHNIDQFERWMKYYEQHGIIAIGAGLITLRKSSKHKNWFRADDGPEKMLGPCGDRVARAFDLRDFLETVQDDAKLLETCLRVSPDLRLERQFGPSNDGWSETATRLQLTRGLAYTSNIDPYMAQMVLGCDGLKPLRQLLADMAAALGRLPTEITSAFCTLVRGLIERGFLLPPGIED